MEYQVDIWQECGKWHVGLCSVPEQYESVEQFTSYTDACEFAAELATTHGCFVCHAYHDEWSSWVKH